MKERAVMEKAAARIAKVEGITEETKGAHQREQQKRITRDIANGMTGSTLCVSAVEPEGLRMVSRYVKRLK
jgi:hypothetical protein